MRRMRKTLMLLAVFGLAAGSVGCFNPLAMGVLTPVPVQPWFTERMDEKYSHPNDFRTPVMPPILPGSPPPICEDPPTLAQCIRALPPVARGIPYIYEEHRDNYRVKVERIKDVIDPPRFFPLVGLAQLHHCHWKCTVYWTETIQTDYPFPYKRVKPRVEVIYIDKDHLHLYTDADPKTQREITREFTQYD